MPAKRRSKSSRHRGSHTHGWGSKKKHRGSGNKGGVGMAGTGKRAQSKKPRHWSGKDGKYFGGKSRVASHLKGYSKRSIEINVGDLGPLAKKSQSINLTELGYSKLLGKGPVVGKLEVTVKRASPLAIKKIEEAGGKVIVAEVASAKE